MCDCGSLTSEVERHLRPNDADVTPPDVPVASVITAERESAAAPGAPVRTGCDPDFRDGCYTVTIRPNQPGAHPLVGTLRVDRAAPASGPDGLIISGDLYRQPSAVVRPDPLRAAPGASVAAAVSRVGLPSSLLRPGIPVHPRSRYHSYLSGTRLVMPTPTADGTPCQVSLNVDEFRYTQPTGDSFRGSFPTSPSRFLRFVLHQVHGAQFEGRVMQGNSDLASVTLTWVSGFLRRAVLEIDTLQGAVAPQPVPNLDGTGTEYFDTLYATAGWELVIDRAESRADIPVPPGINPDTCWFPRDLHALMTKVRKTGADLDAEWRTHLLVIPGRMGCRRGMMYDIRIGVPREGAVAYSDDGYPSGPQAVFFGTAENRLQRDVPRAYLRSAAHEVTHAFNQIHQDIETASDNSIMTPTDAVADVLGGPDTGAPGVFPDQINLGFNPTVRNHLAHMPDPVVRPGGWPFDSWRPAGAPQASDRALFHGDELRFEVGAETDRVPLGAPVTVSWKLTNASDVELMVPSDLGMEALFATMSCRDESREERAVRPVVISCDEAKLAPLAPGASLEESHRVFWSSEGFALDRPGRHTVTVTVGWSAGGVPVGVTGSCEIWVDWPTSDLENRDAALVLHPEVGRWVALDGAPHLEEAAARLRTLDGGAAGTVEAAPGERSRVADAFRRLKLMPGQDGSRAAP
ncbi:hypothetical protein [Kitasatospora sp. Root107]|uniref:hypothetical protein n=1 Tax=Kitasatospora sp. Root107 TaxID=1736424 RepID=UPI00071028BA|nr:hypothetical protein [Kitasatospora sp. Root107]KQV11924.1 hypothetical protein ASC99_35720 [Kitasatospora sp. Root107]